MTLLSNSRLPRFATPPGNQATHMLSLHYLKTSNNPIIMYVPIGLWWPLHYNIASDLEEDKAIQRSFFSLRTTHNWREKTNAFLCIFMIQTLIAFACSSETGSWIILGPPGHKITQKVPLGLIFEFWRLNQHYIKHRLGWMVWVWLD